MVIFVSSCDNQVDKTGPFVVYTFKTGLLSSQRDKSYKKHLKLFDVIFVLPFI